jgi:general secretion pathway protein D
LLKYLFSQTNTEHRENEIVFVLVPHIIRGQELSRSNQDAIDVGTANALELRHINKTVTTPAMAQPPTGAAAPAPQQSAPASSPQVPAAAQAPPSMPASPPSANAQNAQQGSASFLFDPPAITQAKGSTFTINLLMSGAQNVYSVPVQVNYDPNQLEMVNVSNGGFLSQDGQPVALVHRDDPTTGSVQITATRPPGAGGVSGQGGIVTLTFMAKGSGQSVISVTRGGARDPAMQAIPVGAAQAGVTIQ